MSLYVYRIKMKDVRFIKRIFGPFFGLLLFGAALWVLHRQLKVYHLQDILRHFHELPSKAFVLGFLLTVFSYLIMSCYDFLALRYIRHPLSYAKTALASFTAYAFSNNIGFSMIAGSSVRYRLYTAWGLSALEITQVIGFCVVSLWLGFITLGGVIFLFEPLVIPPAFHFPFASLHLLGWTFLSIAGVFILWGMIIKGPVRIRGWSFSFPSPGLLPAQIIVAALDWLLAGSALYVLLPSTPGISFPAFMAVFMTAQLLGLASQIPGGVGVFESTVLLLLSPSIPAPEILGALLAYRGIYYLLPLIAASILLGIQELFRHRRALGRAAHGFGRLLFVAIPQFMALLSFIGGAILLFSGATPAATGRLAWLKTVAPLSVVEVSHFLGSLIGGALLILARGLQRRIDAAYVLTAVLLGGGIVFSLLKGLDYEEAIILAVMLFTLLPCRREFYRSSSLLREGFSPGWIMGILAVLLCSLWLGFFSYKHVEYRGDLWWQFTFSGDAPRFLRATVGVVAVLFFFALAKILRPVSPEAPATGREDMGRVEPIVKDHPKSNAHLALLGDKSFLFNRKGNAFMMFGIEGRSWVAMGDPVGPGENWAELLWEYRQMVDRHGGWSVFYEVGADKLHLYLDLGLTLLKLGEEARVSLVEFSLEGSARKRLRQVVRRIEKEDYYFQVIPPMKIDEYIPALKSVSDAWLKDKNTSEKRFSLGFFHEDYLKKCPIAVIRKGEKIAAFANIWPSGGRAEMSIDMMRFSPDAPNSVIEYLFIQLMLWGKQEEYRWFNLGMAPLSGLADQSLAPLWNRVGAYIFRHGEHFYNFQGLRQYKEKFDPQWSPKYLACPGGLALPLILMNIAALISGGIKGVIAK